jgi:DmsE family decaheme c-type cytochrome
LQRNSINPVRVAVTLLALSLAVTPLFFGVDLSAGEKARISEVCLDCHDGLLDGLMGTPHQMSSETFEGADATIACTDCHVGDERHWEDDPEEYPMTSLADVDADAVALLCATCHMNSHQQNMLEDNIHTMNDVSCADCHGVHGNTHVSLLKSSQPGLCLDCHKNVEGQFAQPFRHPVNDEIVVCTDCHMTIDLVATELSYNGINNACYECHAQFEGPFPYEHQATVDYSTEEGGCLSCHSPHGSYNPRMLKQPYESPHYRLCTQCHSVPLHNNNSFHGTMWAGVPCNDCHSDIHGSYTSRNFLSETLEGQGCFNVGCHQF